MALQCKLMELSDYPIRLALGPAPRYRSRLIATWLANERTSVSPFDDGTRLTEKLDKGNLQVG